MCAKRPEFTVNSMDFKEFKARSQNPSFFVFGGVGGHSPYIIVNNAILSREKYDSDGTLNTNRKMNSKDCIQFCLKSHYCF